jgi:hypothetical protein
LTTPMQSAFASETMIAGRSFVPPWIHTSYLVGSNEGRLGFVVTTAKPQEGHRAPVHVSSEKPARPAPHPGHRGSVGSGEGADMEWGTDCEAGRASIPFKVSAGG